MSRKRASLDNEEELKAHILKETQQTNSSAVRFPLTAVILYFVSTSRYFLFFERSRYFCECHFDRKVTKEK
jgi:hypothetical protein